MRKGKDEIIPGSVVTLNSGGPTMTVVSLQEGEALRCVWSDKDKKLREATYPKVCLKLVKDDSAIFMILPQEFIDKTGLGHAVGELP